MRGTGAAPDGWSSGARIAVAVFQRWRQRGAAVDTALEVGLAGDGVFDDPVRWLMERRGLK